MKPKKKKTRAELEREIELLRAQVESLKQITMAALTRPTPAIHVEQPAVAPWIQPSPPTYPATPPPVIGPWTDPHVTWTTCGTTHFPNTAGCAAAPVFSSVAQVTS